MGFENNKSCINTNHLTSIYLSGKEKAFQSIFENTSIGLAMVSGSGHFLQVNDAMSSMLGYSKEALYGKNCFHLIDNEDVEDVNACHKMIVEGGINLIQFERKIIREDATSLWIKLSSIPVRNKEGHIDFYIIQIENITDQKAIEESLKDSESKWRDLAQNSPDHIMLLNKNLEVIYINRPISGLLSENVMGSSLLSYIPVASHEKVLKSCRRTLKSGNAFTFESRYFVAGTSLGFFESRVGPLRKRGKIISLVISLRDISERKESE